MQLRDECLYDEFLLYLTQYLTQYFKKLNHARSKAKVNSQANDR